MRSTSAARRGSPAAPFDISSMNEGPPDRGDGGHRGRGRAPARRDPQWPLRAGRAHRRAPGRPGARHQRDRRPRRARAAHAGGLGGAAAPPWRTGPRSRPGRARRRHGARAAALLTGMEQAAARGDRSALLTQDEAFHAALWKAAGSATLEELLGNLTARVLPLVRRSIEGMPETELAAMRGWHEELLRGVLAGPDAARAAVGRHAELTRTRARHRQEGT